MGLAHKPHEVGPGREQKDTHSEVDALRISVMWLVRGRAEGGSWPRIDRWASWMFV